MTTEADTEQPETVDLASLLLPEAGQLPQAHRSFALAYNSAALSGWIKQPSPACAAGAVSQDMSCLPKLGSMHNKQRRRLAPTTR